jgi:hypothetical protein
VPAPEWPQPLSCHPAHVGVHCPDGLAGALRLFLASVDDQVERPQSAEEPAPQVVLVIGVVDDPRSNERVRHLEEDGRAAAEERDERRVADAADGAFRLEVAIAAPESFGVRPRTGISCAERTSSHDDKRARACEPTRRFDD